MGKRKKQDDGDGGSGLIQMMTVSLFIILLAFFILLNSIATESEDRKMVALGSIKRSFSFFSGGYSLFKGVGDVSGLDIIAMDTSMIDITDLSIADGKLIPHIQVLPRRAGSMVRMPADMLFNPGETKIKPAGYAYLDRLCKVANKNDYPIDIIGHTDIGMIDAKDTNKVISNREVSVIRSFSVLNYFVDKGKVDPKRLTAFGWGDTRPVYFDKTKESRRLNERIDLVFVHSKFSKKPKGVFNFKDFFFNAFEKS